MLAENTKAFIQMIEDPSRRRYAGAVNTATENTIPETFGNYKIYSVGDLAVATIVRSPVVCQVAIFSTFAQDTRDRKLSHLSGIQLAVATASATRPVEHEKPQKWIEPVNTPLEEWIRDEYTEVCLDDFVAIATEKPKDRSDLVVRMDADDAIDLADGAGGINNRTGDEIDKIAAGHNFFAEMDEAGHNNADPDAVERVSEGLEIIVFPGKWRRGRRISRAETLFREGLGLEV